MSFWEYLFAVVISLMSIAFLVFVVFGEGVWTIIKKWKNPRPHQKQLNKLMKEYHLMLRELCPYKVATFSLLGVCNHPKHLGTDCACVAKHPICVHKKKAFKGTEELVAQIKECVEKIRQEEAEEDMKFMEM